MTGHYKQLKHKLHQLDIDYRYIANVIGKSHQTVKQAMTGRLKFDIDDCWKIFDLTGEDKAKFVEYFPRSSK